MSNMIIETTKVYFATCTKCSYTGEDYDTTQGAQWSADKHTKEGCNV